MFDKSSKNEKNKPSSTKTSATTVAPAATGGAKTTIGASIKITGEVTGGEDLVIQGSVEGTINLKDHNVSIGEQGRIMANVFARSIIVQGELNGDLHGAEKVTVTTSGKVKGNITAPRVVLEDGASFKGSIDMESKPAAASKGAEGGVNLTKSQTA